MNYQLLGKNLGIFALAIGAAMLPSMAWAVYFGEWRALTAFTGSLIVSALLGGALIFLGRNASLAFYQRETLGLVGLSWIIAAFLGALPYVFAGVFGPIDAYFESMSGFTTTGSSVMEAAEFATTPKSIMFWRSFTHWLGGMGIVVLMIAVLPYLGAGGKQMFRSEAPGPDPRGLRPRIKDTASILYKIYLAFTVVQTILLMLAGMSFFDGLCHTFGTLATGGFSTHPASVGGYNNMAVEIIIIVFMVIAGTNFALYFSMLRGDWRATFKDSEWRMYMIIMAAATLIITANLLGAQWHAHFPSMTEPDTSPVHLNAGTAVRQALFQVTSVMTTTGFGTADFDSWPSLSRMLLVMLMFVGGCAGSTGGGLKVVRLIMLVKMAYWRLESAFRPKTVRAIRVSGELVSEEVQRLVYGFFVLFMGVFVFGCLFMTALGLPFETALTSVAATLNNIGPGLEHVGPMANFRHVPGIGKLFLVFCMVLGRLELFTIMVMLIPSFWSRD